jgi:hypothetical protein
MASETAGAIRQRRRRERRARGFFCINVEIGDADVAGFIARGMLDRFHAMTPKRSRWLSRFLDLTLAGNADRA